MEYYLSVKKNEIMKFVGKCSSHPSFEEVFLCNRWRPLQEITSNEHAELRGPVPTDTFTTKFLHPRLRDPCGRR